MFANLFKTSAKDIAKYADAYFFEMTKTSIEIHKKKYNDLLDGALDATKDGADTKSYEVQSYELDKALLIHRNQAMKACNLFVGLATHKDVLNKINEDPQVAMRKLVYDVINYTPENNEKNNSNESLKIFAGFAGVISGKVSRTLRMEGISDTYHLREFEGAYKKGFDYGRELGGANKISVPVLLQITCVAYISQAQQRIAEDLPGFEEKMKKESSQHDVADVLKKYIEENSDKISKNLRSREI